MSKRQVVVATLGGIHQLASLKELIDEVLKVYPEAFFGIASEGEYDDMYEYPVFYNLFEETELDKSVELAYDEMKNKGYDIDNFVNWKTIMKSENPIEEAVLDELYQKFKGSYLRLSSDNKILEVEIPTEEFEAKLSILEEDYTKAASKYHELLDMQIEQDESRWLWGGE